MVGASVYCSESNNGRDLQGVGILSEMTLDQRQSVLDQANEFRNDPVMQRNINNPSITMTMTLDEAHEEFDTPRREELQEKINEEKKRIERRSFWSSIWGVLGWIPLYILNSFKK